LMFVRNKMFDRAEKNLKRAIELDPEYSEARVNLSFLYIEKGLFDEAIESGLKAIENITYSTPERAYNNVGWAYYKKGDLDNAANYFSKAMIHDKLFFLPHKNLAMVYMEKGKYQEARKEYEASIKGCEECADLYYGLGLTLLKLKDKKGAVKMFEECRNRSKDKDDDFSEKCASKLAVLK
jgi:type IV pilus assembly protein PilF